MRHPKKGGEIRYFEQGKHVRTEFVNDHSHYGEIRSYWNGRIQVFASNMANTRCTPT